MLIFMILIRPTEKPAIGCDSHVQKEDIGLNTKNSRHFYKNDGRFRPGSVKIAKHGTIEHDGQSAGRRTRRFSIHYESDVRRGRCRRITVFLDTQPITPPAVLS